MSQVRTWKHAVLLSITILLWSFSLSFVAAQSLPCGDIQAPQNFFTSGPDDSLTRVAIEDCEDPFSLTVNPTSPYNLVIEGQEVENGGTIALPEGRTKDIVVNGNSNLDGTDFWLFKHNDNDYVYKRQTAPEPTNAELEAYADTFFPTTQEAQFYLTILDEYLETGDTDRFFYEESGEDIIDSNTEQTVESRFYSFYYSALDYYEVVNKPYVETGTYTIVMSEYELILVQRSILDKIFDLFIKTAHAQYISQSNTYAITFTITEEAVEPTGASSVLFIPGIMGSRLYEESAECATGYGEQERWFSFDECDQLRMATNFTGQSINNLYTKPGLAGIVDDVRIVSNIYETFLESLQDWEDEGTINGYGVLPYDWRLGLDTIIRSELNLATGRIIEGSSVEEGYFYSLVTDLVEDSANGKVTIVAHSNGGLVAKHFLDALEKTNDPLLDKIENLVLVAVPQVGTPEAVIGILHGLELGPLGLVLSQQTARQLSNKMNFAHHLLPTLRYFESVDTPVITIETGASTEAWRNEFGDTISSRDTLHDFLDDDSARIKPASGDLNTPEVVEGILLDYAKTVDTIQTNWEVPETLKVYQVAGTGLETPSGLTYFTDRSCISRTFFVCTGYADKIGYRVNMSIDGDASVVVPSALVLQDNVQIERWWLNLFTYNDDATINRDHKSILEVEETNDFIKQTVLVATSTNFTYLTNTPPVLDNEEPRLMFQLHSPLDMSLHTSDGREVSSSTETIIGATYRRYGELQYISVPSTEGDLVLSLQGLATGSFTLDIEEIENGDIKRQTYSAVPSSTSTKVQVPITSATDIAEAVLLLDYEGDGITDAEYDTQGIIEDEIAYEDLFESIQNLNLKRAYEKVLLTTAQAAEKLYERSLVQVKYKKVEIVTLQVLKQQLVLYEKLRIITRIQSQSVVQVVDELINR